jgi:hypothetical protein
MPLPAHLPLGEGAVCVLYVQRLPQEYITGRQRGKTTALATCESASVAVLQHIMLTWETKVFRYHGKGLRSIAKEGGTA